MHLLDKKLPVRKWFESDKRFNQIYPLSVQALASKHWTPLIVAKKAATFLAVESGTRILDIGSGVGKFCLAAAHHKPNALFYGIEQRRNLIGYAESAKNLLQADNVCFIYGNFTQLDFRNFDHFYFFNSFYENLTGTEKIDDTIDYSVELYKYYNCYLYKQLEHSPVGTRVATFHSFEEIIPQCYHEVGAEFDGLLKFWSKV